MLLQLPAGTLLFCCATLNHDLKRLEILRRCTRTALERAFLITAKHMPAFHPLRALLSTKPFTLTLYHHHHHHYHKPIPLARLDLQVLVYQLDAEGPADDDEGEEAAPSYREWALPATEFHGLVPGGERWLQAAAMLWGELCPHLLAMLLSGP